MEHTGGALEGVRVIDLASVVMGPYAIQILGDLGTDVIKVEAPGGDMVRRTHPQRHPGMAAPALNVNRNKRSLALDPGMTDLMRRATGTPAYASTIMADKVCALTIVYSVLAALFHQRATGQGQHVEVPMTDAMLAFNLVEHLAGHTFEPAEGPTGFNRSMATGHRAVATADGHACILPYTPRDTADFFAAVGRDDLAADPRFADPASLSAHQGDLYDLVGSVAGERTTDEWERLCGQQSIPFAAVLELEQIEDGPHVVDGGVLSTEQHPTEGGYRSIGFPVRLSRTPVGLRAHCPTLGQDSAAVLRELGRSEAEIAAMAAEGTAVLATATATPTPEESR